MNWIKAVSLFAFLGINLQSTQYQPPNPKSVSGISNSGDGAALAGSCPLGLEDGSNAFGPCISASSIPADGKLFPLSDKFFVTTNGKVGIGTKAPTDTLDVRGTGAFNPGGSGGGQILLSTPGGETGMILRNAQGSGPRADLRFNGSTLKLATSSSGSIPDPTSGIAITTAGKVGIGTNSPNQKLEVVGTIQSTGFKMTGGASSGYVLTSDASGIASWQPTAASGVGGSGTTNSISKFTSSGTIGNSALYENGGKVGIGTSSPGASLHVSTGEVRFPAGMGSSYGNTHFNYMGNGRNFIRGETVIADGGGKVSIGTAAPAADATLTVAGKTETTCIRITGGCDIAEPFEILQGGVEPGMVLSIDPKNEGKLRLSCEAYDKTVAGVVSGAGGVKTGLSLSQEGLLEYGLPVALTGRVYCKADASFGAIQPGDLLTTSSTPGHAMKVADSVRSQGAILGKAMTALKEGRGEVLILVSLQ